MNTKVLIWGTGKLAYNCMKRKLFSSDDIVGFVDTFKTDETFWDVYPIYKPNEINAIEYDCLFVFIMRKNNEILKLCHDNEIPLNKVFFVDQNDKAFFSENEGCFYQYEQMQCNFPSVYEYMKNKADNRNFYINEIKSSLINENVSVIRKIGNTHVLVWIPIELLYMQNQKDNDVNFTKEWIEFNNKLENLPIISNIPHYSLIDYIFKGKEIPDRYLKWYEEDFVTQNRVPILNDKELLEKRNNDFIYMQTELGKGMDFFIEHPVLAFWNNRGYFNLLDGHHRTCFLYSSGIRYIPVQITKDDYDKWCNYEWANKLYNKLVSTDRVEFYQPILHPFYKNIQPYREGVVKSRIHHLMYKLGNKRLNGISVIDIGANLGYMGQAFYRLGADVTFVEMDKFHYEVLEIINKLLYVDGEIITDRFEEYDFTKSYDIAIMLTVMYHYMNKRDILERFIEKINCVVNKMIIWESGDDIEKEKEYIISNTKFKKFEHICYTYGTGKIRELGIFSL